MDDIRAAALAAVAEVSATHEQQGSVLDATRIVREQTGCPLRDAIDAVKWAVDRPPAATLPFGTIVASPFAAVWVKEEESSIAARPWTATHRPGTISDAEVDKALRTGGATILRIGTGES